MTTAPAALKAELRQAALIRRRGLSEAARTKFSVRLAREGLRLAKNFEARAVSAFSAFPDEPDTAPLLTTLAEAGFPTLLPITSARGAPLVFRFWRPGDPTRPGRMNIPEPLPSAVAGDPEGNIPARMRNCGDRHGRGQSGENAERQRDEAM